MAIGAKVNVVFPEARKWTIDTGAGANQTITHGLGRVPAFVIVTPIGTTTYGAVLVSYSDTTIVVYLESGVSADVIAVLG